MTGGNATGLIEHYSMAPFGRLARREKQHTEGRGKLATALLDW